MIAESADDLPMLACLGGQFYPIGEYTITNRRNSREVHDEDICIESRGITISPPILAVFTTPRHPEFGFLENYDNNYIFSPNYRIDLGVVAVSEYETDLSVGDLVQYKITMVVESTSVSER